MCEALGSISAPKKTKKKEKKNKGLLPSVELGKISKERKKKKIPLDGLVPDLITQNSYCFSELLNFFVPTPPNLTPSN
jgi:hypothetical protein